MIRGNQGELADCHTCIASGWQVLYRWRWSREDLALLRGTLTWCLCVYAIERDASKNSHCKSFYADNIMRYGWKTLDTTCIDELLSTRWNVVHVAKWIFTALMTLQLKQFWSEIKREREIERGNKSSFCIMYSIRDTKSISFQFAFYIPIFISFEIRNTYSSFCCCCCCFVQTV